MTTAENLLADLAEVSQELADWAEHQIEAGRTPEQVLEQLRDAARIAGRA